MATVPSGTNTIFGALVYQVYLRIFHPGPSNPTTFLGICSSDDYRHYSLQLAPPPSTLQRWHLNSLFMITFCDYSKNDVDFDEIYPFDYKVYLSIGICRMRWAE